MYRIRKDVIIPRIDGITHDIEKLRQLAKLSLDEFSKEDNFALAQFYLRRALEGVFNIGNHIVSQLPGNKVTQYKEIARKLGDIGIVDKKFAYTKLVQMAGYRNRLTHFYADVTVQELHKVLQQNLNDFDVFLTKIKELLQHPEKFGFTIE